MSNFYCECCGVKTNSISSLTSSNCTRHPNGPSKGKHILYQGQEKSEYFCKYCGVKSLSISSLTAGNCTRHPNGVSKDIIHQLYN